MSEKREAEGFLCSFFAPAFWQQGPRRESRLIGSFGLEKWISPTKKTCFLPNQMTNELSICCLQSRGHNAPSVRMMDLIMAKSPRFTVLALPGSSAFSTTPTTTESATFVPTDALLHSRKMTNTLKVALLWLPNRSPLSEVRKCHKGSVEFSEGNPPKCFPLFSGRTNSPSLQLPAAVA